MQRYIGNWGARAHEFARGCRKLVFGNLCRWILWRQELTVGFSRVLLKLLGTCSVLGIWGAAYSCPVCTWVTYVCTVLRYGKGIYIILVTHKHVWCLNCAVFASNTAASCHLKIWPFLVSCQLDTLPCLGLINSKNFNAEQTYWLDQSPPALCARLVWDSAVVRHGRFLGQGRATLSRL